MTAESPFSFLFYFLSSIQIVELLKLHLSSCFVFVYEQVLDWKKMKLKKQDHRKSIVCTQSKYRSSRFRPIPKQKVEQVKNRSYTNCRASHAASLVVFCFY